ncbi:flagellar hook capping FlgD N-terminal domain-containing protein [Oceaniglobus ichthyenteri]|uniref:flagellar hook capping FlgD N-terminal domain-containing protein n=1 Tax=Oceaniglobus ichthyenteri TaxID=2136177 RepID=UPI000D3A4BC7|nr:flagellar hook capping FlgD N-terminal domain-containing protein [Oceaniglobus ichthyenteri]
MEISPTTASLSGPGATTAAQPQNGAAITSDFDTFLRMLTAQISNQDPLNPMNSEQFAVQLATFSGVEQQVRTNQLIETLTSQLSGSGFSQMAGWVGMEARAPMPTYYSGEPLSVTPPTTFAGNSHDLVAIDIDGNEIWRAGYTPGSGSVQWDGVLPNGTTVAPGLYGFRLESYEDDRLVATAAAQTYGRVEEVRMERTGPVLVFAGGVQLAAEEVSGLRGATAPGDA